MYEKLPHIALLLVNFASPPGCDTPPLGGTSSSHIYKKALAA